MIALKHIIRFIILTFLQIFIFSYLQILNYGIVFIHIFFLLFLPLTLKRWQSVLIAFVMGLLIDYFTGTYGLHAFASTFIVYVRKILLKTSTNKYTDDEEEEFYFSYFTTSQFLTYVGLASIIYSVLFFVLDYFSIQAILRVILHIIFSTISSVLCIFIYRTLFTDFRKERN